MRRFPSSNQVGNRLGLAVGVLLLTAAVFSVTAGVPSQALAARHRAHRAAVKAVAPPASDEPYVEAAVMEPTSGTFIFEKNDHQPWPTASLAKMMLMLVVVQKVHDGSLKLTDQITTSREAAKMGGSQVYLKEGEVFSLDDMMKAVVVHSANDASLAVAEYVAGSAQAFVQLMNQQAAALGMKDTHYYSVHGLPPAPGQQADVASAYDQALLARELLKYPEIVRWSSIDTAPFRGGAFELRNTNHLVRTYPGCDGLKTGFYDKAGFNVAATAKRGNLRMIAVVLGTPHKLTNFKEAAELMSAGFADYEMASIVKKGTPASQTVAIADGAAPTVVPVFAMDAAILSRRGESKKKVTVTYNLPASINAPVKAGQQIGTAQMVADGKPVDSVALIAPADVAKKGGGLLRRMLGKL
ncbi:MAG: D-alanyl-D-alanine carboxypeptidase [Deltaproteobacteria bacterium]|nr:D-alanyl-D-alanine carboxypeptidase [Deltaproteobacteria bacterium]